MNSQLKTLGLALLAALALGAVAVSASAQEGKITSDGPVTLTFTEIGGTNSLQAFGNTVECDTTYTGHKTNSTTLPKEFIPSGATAVTITPHHSNCKDQNGVKTTINMRSCDMELYDFTTTGGVAGTYGVTAGIICSTAGDYIEIDKESGCDVRLLPKTAFTGAHLTDEGNGHLRLHGHFHNLTATTPCFDLETSAASLGVDLTVKGHNMVQDPTAIALSH